MQIVKRSLTTASGSWCTDHSSRTHPSPVEGPGQVIAGPQRKDGHGGLRAEFQLVQYRQDPAHLNTEHWTCLTLPAARTVLKKHVLKQCVLNNTGLTVPSPPQARILRLGTLAYSSNLHETQTKHGVWDFTDRHPPPATVAGCVCV